MPAVSFDDLIPKSQPSYRRPDPSAAVQADVPGARITSTLRSPAHNRAVGGVSDSYHLKGEAVDFVPPKGMTRAQALAAIRTQDPHPRELLDEGSHVHYVPGQMPTSVDFGDSVPKAPTAAQPKPKVSFDDLVPGVKPKVSFGDLVPKSSGGAANQAGSYLGDTFGKTVTGAAHQVAQDVREDVQAQRHGDLIRSITHPFEAGGVARLPKELWDVAGAMSSPITGAYDAAVARPIAIAGHAINPQMPREKQEAGQMTALWGVGPEAGVKGIPHPEALSVEGPKRGGVPKPVRPEEPGTVEQVAAGAGRLKRAAQSSFAASTMSDAARDTAAIVRRSSSESATQHAQVAAKLNAYDKVVGRLPVAQQRAIVNYIEGAGEAPKDPGVKAAADAIAKSYKSWRDRIEYVLDEKERPNFLENYYAHMWKEKPSVVRDSMDQYFRQGSGRSFKKRSIPTMQEGIEAGLTPRTENPIENTIAYSANMQRFLNTLDIRNTMIKGDLASYYTPGQHPDGWVPLEGILTEKPGFKEYERPTSEESEAGLSRELVRDQPGKRLYAPEDAARIYNRAISRGFEAGSGAPIYEAARKTSNVMTAVRLGLSGYHAVAESIHASASDVARGINAALTGHPVSAAKSLGKAATLIGSPIRTTMKGGDLRRLILDGDDVENLPPVAKAYIQSGGRVKMDPLYSATSSRTFYQAVKNKTFGLELQRAAEKLYTGSALDRAKGVMSIAANMMQSTMGPLFEDYIPRLKAGAFAQRYSDWLEQNPTASRAQADAFARKLTDSVDNRFGEMIQDNLFWHKQMKQVAQIMMLAPGWKLGLLREFVGGLGDVPKSAINAVKGKGVSDRTAYLVGLLAMTAYANGIATYLKTGTMPKGRDFAAYRTGGTLPATDYDEEEPERASLPGQQKDIYEQVEAFDQLVRTGDPSAETTYWKDAANPALETAGTAATNSNWRGDPIIPGEGVQTQPGDKNLLAHEAEEDFMPITFLNFKRQEGSNISAAERLGGIKRAPQYLGAPDRYKSGLAARNQRRYDQAQKHVRTEEGDAP